MRVDARDHSIHPVRDWLSSLEWDGKRRLDRWLTMTFGAELDQYHSAWGQKSPSRPFGECGSQAANLILCWSWKAIKGSEINGNGRSVRPGVDADDLGACLSSKDAAIGLLGKWAVEFGEI